MSASRLLSLFRASIIHTRTTLCPAPPPQLRNPFVPRIPSLSFRSFSSSSVAIDDVAGCTSETPSSSDDSRHPWPEWIAFVDRLQAKGYIDANPSPAAAVGDSAAGDGDGDGDVYKDMMLLKDATLSFARDRFDIFKSLSRDDIQKVVESGCPNLFRKAVNSAKRLRAYVQLDEGEVCSGCNLRGSCDRAYVILKDYEEAPRTVDIVRILLFHALDPLVISCGEKPTGTALIEASARRLLSELILLSETSPDPATSNFIARASHQSEPSSNSKDDERSKDVEMKRGDWICPKCNFMNFSKNLRCLKCKEDGPKRVSRDNVEMKKGDWVCSKCNFMNFARNVRCLRCKEDVPERVGLHNVEMKKGDWICPKCNFMNFAIKRNCLRCQEQRPKRQLEPGEWECPSCDFLNFKGNITCRKCSCERPKEAASVYEEQIWSRPS